MSGHNNCFISYWTRGRAPKVEFAGVYSNDREKLNLEGKTKNTARLGVWQVGGGKGEAEGGHRLERGASKFSVARAQYLLFLWVVDIVHKLCQPGNRHLSVNQLLHKKLWPIVAHAHESFF